MSFLSWIQQKKEKILLTNTWNPRDYQRKAVEFLLSRKFAGLLLDPGDGKTSTILQIIVHLKKFGEVKKVLIIAPLRVCLSTWPAEIDKWDNFKHLTWVFLHEKGKKDVIKDVDIYIINPEGLSWAISFLLKLHKFEMLVVDESTMFKNINSQRFKLLKSILDKFPRRYILTGTIIPNGYEDLFGQMFILDKGLSLTPYITKYRQIHFTPHFNGIVNTYKLIKGHDILINEKVKDYLFKIENPKDGVPNIIEVDRKISLSKDVMTAYESLEKDYITTLGGNVLVFDNNSSSLIKLHQIANGVLKTDEGACEIHRSKLDNLKDLIEELNGRPLMVCYTFNNDRDFMYKEFGKIPCICGDTPKSEFIEIIGDWNLGIIPVLLVQPMAVKHGLNMQESCAHVCWYSQTFDYEVYTQTNARVVRLGNPSSTVTVHRILSKGTVDEVMIKALKFKDKAQEKFFELLTGDRM